MWAAADDEDVVCPPAPSAAADALSSLRPEGLPLWLRHKAVTVKRAKSGVHDIADLQREVSVLQQCSQPHALPFAPLLSGARGEAPRTCLSLRGQPA